MKYDRYEDRFDLGDTVLYNDRKWKITSYSKDRFGLVSIDDEKGKKIEVDINNNNNKIEDLELEKVIL